MTIEEKVREQLPLALGVPMQDAAYERVMAVIETALALKAREAYIEAAHDAQGGGLKFPSVRYPLPKRTKKVLREEPVGLVANGPGLYYRWVDGYLECGTPGVVSSWRKVHAIDNGPRGFALMRHAINLHDNPYRTIEVEADESNPWPEVTP